MLFLCKNVRYTSVRTIPIKFSFPERARARVSGRNELPQIQPEQFKTVLLEKGHEYLIETARLSP